MSSNGRPRVLVAYKDEQFLDSDAARPLRILAEYLEPLHVFDRERIRDTIVFFGSARLSPEGPLGHFYEAVRELARIVTVWSNSLPSHTHRYVVCTGGGGIMEAANRGASEAGGKTIGLNIGLPHEKQPNAYLRRELTFEFHYFFMRKLWFALLARALIVFPGGFGTLDELSEIPDADADEKDQTSNSCDSLWVAVLERSDQFRGARPARNDRSRGSRAISVCRRPCLRAGAVAGRYRDRGRGHRASDCALDDIAGLRGLNFSNAR